MSELVLIKWPKDKVAGFVNSVPKGTLVFSYGEEVKKNGNGTTNKFRIWHYCFRGNDWYRYCSSSNIRF